MRRVIVVGGGPAGMMAAGQVAKLGAETLLLEKMNRPGRKLRLTGKGRCNLTNVAPLSDFIDKFGVNGRFLRYAFSQFFNQDLVAFLEDQGVRTVTERGGRVFTVSGQAQEVVDALMQWINKCGVNLQTRAAVRSLILEKDQVTGVQVFPHSSRKKIDI